MFGFECDVPQYPEIWEFPKSWGYPCSSSIYSWIFHEINHPATGGTPIVGNPHISKNVHPSSLRVEEASLEWGLVAPSRPFRSFCKKMRFCLTHSTRGGTVAKKKLLNITIFTCWRQSPSSTILSGSNMIYTLQTRYSLATQVRTVACCFQTILISGWDIHKFFTGTLSTRGIYSS